MFLEFCVETSNWYQEWKKKSPKFHWTEDDIRKIISSEDEFDKELTEKLFLGGHDAGRSKDPLGGSRYKGLIAFVQSKFLSQKGSEQIKAWYLHHLIDFIISSPLTDVEEKIKRIEERTNVPEFSRKEFEEVACFFEENFNDILNCINQENQSKKK